jgi:hypothetical protein
MNGSDQDYQDTSTGDVEVHVDKYTVLNPAIKLPFRSDDRFELVRFLSPCSSVMVHQRYSGRSTSNSGQHTAIWIFVVIA